MRGKKRATDNIYIERVWRSLKYENIYSKNYETLKGFKKLFFTVSTFRRAIISRQCDLLIMDNCLSFPGLLLIPI